MCFYDTKMKSKGKIIELYPCFKLYDFDKRQKYN